MPLSLFSRRPSLPAGHPVAVGSRLPELAPSPVFFGWVRVTAATFCPSQAPPRLTLPPPCRTIAALEPSHFLIESPPAESTTMPPSGDLTLPARSFLHQRAPATISHPLPPLVGRQVQPMPCPSHAAPSSSTLEPVRPFHRSPPPEPCTAFVQRHRSPA
jgi:hypothetical protein